MRVLFLILALAGNCFGNPTYRWADNAETYAAGTTLTWTAGPNYTIVTGTDTYEIGTAPWGGNAVKIVEAGAAWAGVLYQGYTFGTLYVTGRCSATTRFDFLYGNTILAAGVSDGYMLQDTGGNNTNTVLQEYAGGSYTGNVAKTFTGGPTGGFPDTDFAFAVRRDAAGNFSYWRNGTLVAQWLDVSVVTGKIGFQIFQGTGYYDNVLASDAVAQNDPGQGYFKTFSLLDLFSSKAHAAVRGDSNFNQIIFDIKKDMVTVNNKIDAVRLRASGKTPTPIPTNTPNPLRVLITPTATPTTGIR